jgi:alkylation response protein AidB-like acyl-CoA dehydrogenase
MSAQIEAARTLLHCAAAMEDAGTTPSIVPYVQAKVLCAEAAVRVTQVS